MLLSQCSSVVDFHYLIFYIFSTENIFVNGTLKTAKHGEVVGCPVKYDWCKTTPQIWLPSFIFAVFCLAVGFATSFTILISLYTKLLPNQKQVRSWHIFWIMRILTGFVLYKKI